MFVCTAKEKIKWLWTCNRGGSLLWCFCCNNLYIYLLMCHLEFYHFASILHNYLPSIRNSVQHAISNIVFDFDQEHFDQCYRSPTPASTSSTHCPQTTYKFYHSYAQAKTSTVWSGTFWSVLQVAYSSFHLIYTLSSDNIQFLSLLCSSQNFNCLSHNHQIFHVLSQPPLLHPGCPLPLPLPLLLIWKTYVPVTYVCNFFLSLVFGSKYVTCILLKFKHDDMMCSKFTMHFENSLLPVYFLTFF